MKKRSFLQMLFLSLIGGSSNYSNCLAQNKKQALEKKDSFFKENNITERNKEAINYIIASKKHFDIKSIGATNNGTHLFTLAHISDIHTDEMRFENFVRFINDVDFIDAAIGTGDFVISSKQEEYVFLNQSKFNKTFLKVVGNHERVGNHSTLSYVYEKMNMGTNSDTGKLYYYKDFNAYKIRIIILNQFDIDTDNFKINECVEHFSKEQIDWFIESLKDAQQKDYAVAIAMHAPDMDTLPIRNDKGFYQRHYSWSNTAIISGPVIEDIVDAFKYGKRIKKSYLYSDLPDKKISVDTSFNKKGIFMAYMVGHKHGDFVGYSKFHSDQLYLLINISCCMPKSRSHNYGEEVSDLPRVEGTQTEDCFNVYSFDLENQLVKVVRIGSSVNDKMENRKKACFSFDGSDEHFE